MSTIMADKLRCVEMKSSIFIIKNRFYGGKNAHKVNVDKDT